MDRTLSGMENARFHQWSRVDGQQVMNSGAQKCLHSSAEEGHDFGLWREISGWPSTSHFRATKLHTQECGDLEHLPQVFGAPPYYSGLLSNHIQRVKA